MFDVVFDRLKGFAFRVLRERGVILCLRRTQMDNREMNQSYTDGAYQILLDDSVRNVAYETVIRKLVSGKRVVDIGTGASALLAEMCVRAGAEKVYAIEENSQSLKTAQRRIERSGMASDIELVSGFSTEVELAEPCDVLVHEIVGSVGSAEGMTLVVNDAKQRFLTPDAEFIPHACTTWICPVEPLKLPLLDAAISGLGQLLYSFQQADLYKVFNFPPANVLGPAAEFETTVFCEDMPLTDCRDLELVIARAGDLEGLVLFLEIHVDQQTVINSLYQRTNWSTPYVKLFSKPIAVVEGDVVHVTVQRELSTTQPKYELDVRICPKTSGVELTRHFAWQGN